MAPASPPLTGASKKEILFLIILLSEVINSIRLSDVVE